jgi:glycosyltransferase involved in cell wall biosynthesis
MIIVTTLYNAENYIEQCISSIMGQSFKDFKCYITDDLSTDNSVAIVKKLIADDDRFILIENTKKLYQPGNYDQVIRNNSEINDNDVIVEIDGDDWLPSSKTLEKLNEIYQDKNVWITNGSFKYSTGQNGFSSKQKIDENLRMYPMTCSHIRTWRAFLWRNIEQEDLKDDDGEYWKVTGDLAFMFPMLEMAGDEHYHFIEDIMYVYNGENPMNDHKVNMTIVNVVANKIRSMKKYSRLNVKY